MIETKKKICKGNRNQTTGCGCETNQYIFKFGLCKQCFKKWLYSDAGKPTLTKTLERSKKVVQNALKQQAADKRKQQKESIKTKSDYEKELQTLINWIVRDIDSEKGCISCEHGWNNDFTRQKHASHRYSVGSNQQIRFNLFNIYVSCSICNNWLSGNPTGYDEILQFAYPPEVYNETFGLRAKYKGLKLTIDELKHAIINAKKVQKMLKDGKELNRFEINNLINIYR